MSDRSRSRSKSGSKQGSGSDDEEEEAYEVEEIRDKRRGDDGDWLYYVKWIGWDSDTNTWEPKEHLSECREKLEDFERRWRRKQERKEERRKDERKQKQEERRQRELKAAARYSLKHDDGDSGADYSRQHKEKKEKKKMASDSDSDAGGNNEEREKERERRREEKKKKQASKSSGDRIMEKKDRDEKERREEKERRKEEEKRKEEKKKPKYYKDIRPAEILGVTTDPGELCFYVKWDSGVEPGLVTAKEAYQKMPQMILKFYESKLIWRDKPPKTKEEAAKDVKEMVNGIENVKISPDTDVTEKSKDVKMDGDDKTEATEKSKDKDGDLKTEVNEKGTDVSKDIDINKVIDSLDKDLSSEKGELKTDTKVIENGTTAEEAKNGTTTGEAKKTSQVENGPAEAIAPSQP